MSALPKLTPRHKLKLLVMDVLLFQALFFCVFNFRIGNFRFEHFFAPGVLFVLFCLLAASYILGCYDVDDTRGRHLAARLLGAVLITFGIVILINYLLAKQRHGLFGRGVLLGTFVSFYFCATTFRLLYRRHFKRTANRLRWLILCDTRIDEMIRRDRIESDLRGQYQTVDVTRQAISTDTLPDADGYVVAISSSDLTEPLKKFLLQRKMDGVVVVTWADFIEAYLRKIPVEHIQMDWFLFHSGYGLLTQAGLVRVKRLHDLLLSIVFLLLSWPIMLIAALAVKADSRGPALFSQRRTGLKGREFTIYKFRSMRTDAEAAGPQWATEKDSRVTRIGNFLRKSRLDELPQLINVLKGDMSFIGPRPERPEFNEDLEKQIPFYAIRHLVRPGLTGWAQISYPYGASVTDAKNKLEYDLFYIKNYSFILDYSILLRTIKIVLFGRGR